MIKTFEDLFKKLESDGRCRSVPEARLKKIQDKLPGPCGEEAADRHVNWIMGYLFSLMDEGYITDMESAYLRNLAADIRYE